MMKGDVLSGFKKLKVCTAYSYKGETITHLPYNIEEENVTPIYTEMDGWQEDLTKMRNKSEFPSELNAYIDFLEKELEVPISIVSVGPDRTQKPLLSGFFIYKHLKSMPNASSSAIKNPIFGENYTVEIPAWRCHF